MHTPGVAGSLGGEKRTSRGPLIKHPFDKHLLSIYYVPPTLLGPGIQRAQGHNPCPQDLEVCVGMQDHKQVMMEQGWRRSREEQPWPGWGHRASEARSRRLL